MPKFRPTVVIGLGGTGKQVLVSLKRMIAENAPHGLNDFPFLRLLEIDTDVAIPTAKSKIQTLNERDLTLDPGREVYQLTGDWIGALKVESFPELREWFPSQLDSRLIASEFRLGAGMKKPLGRFAFAYNAPAVYDKLRTTLDGIANLTVIDVHGVGRFELDDKLSVFICGSLCGGTGAGTFLDAAYMVRHIAHALNKTIYTFGMFAMSSVFDGMQGDFRIKPNCYASLVELDHFSNELTFKNPYQRFRPAYKNFVIDYDNCSNDKPYDFPFLFDKTNQATISFDSPQDLGEMIARFIYLLSGSEASDHFNSMDNNVRANLPRENPNNKPSIYRSMGTMSFVYPKRLVQQLLGYTLCKRYFDIILDRSYNSTEVQALADRFLNDYKFNPKSSLLDRFKSFKPQGSAEGDFAAYAQSSWEDFLGGEGGLKQTDKKQYSQRLREFIEQMELQFSAYRDQNASRAKDLKREFASVLDKRVGEMLSLARIEDKANGGKPSRGSARRVENMLDLILNVFEDAKDRFKREEDAHAAEVKAMKSDLASHLEEVQSCADSLLPQGGRLKKELEETGSCICSYLASRQAEYAKNQAFQLLDGIRDRLGDEDGVLVGLRVKAASFKNMCKQFEEAGAAVARILADNVTYKSGSLVRALFDFRTDIEETFQRLWKDPDKGEELVLTQLSDGLKSDDCFGPTYDKAAMMGQSAILRNALRLAEKPFGDMVNAVNIEDRILANGDFWENFKGGSFWSSASIFVQINGAELSRVGIDIRKTEFFAITIPDEHYIGAPCSALKGPIENLPGTKKCPIDDEASKLTCPRHGKCIKQALLDGAPEHVAIVPTSERGEINIIKAVAGFPLHALSSAAVCQPYYRKTHEQELREAHEKRLEEEQLHMFGPIQLPDLFELTEDSSIHIGIFKAKLLLAYAVKRLTIERLSVAFYTAEDLAYEADASLKLGANVAEVIRRFQSNRSRDRTELGLFLKELDIYVESFFDGSDPERLEKLFARLKTVYTEMKSGAKIPDGFVREEADSLNAFALERFKRPLAEVTASRPKDNF